MGGRHFGIFEVVLVPEDVVTDEVARGQLAEANPFDPAQVAVDGLFESPDGAVFRVPAFVYQGYSRAADADGRERLTPSGEREWRVRFRPPMDSPEGAWRFSMEVALPAGGYISEATEFRPVRVDGHGVVRRSRFDARQLAFEDGAPFVAIGENMAWYDKRGTFAYDQWMKELAEYGGNYLRVWMPSWAFGIEWGEVGDYGGRLDRAWQLDQVYAKAEALDLQVMLTLQNHGPFSTLHASEWDRNPYNAKNGGPLATPAAFFTDPEARRLFKQRLRYIVARWGQSAHLLAWELWNEVDLVTDPGSEAVVSWNAEMAAELRRLDVHDHLVTTSLGGLDAFAAYFADDVPSLVSRFGFWSAPEIDFTQLHFYGLGPTEIDFSDALPRLVDYLAVYGKPVLVAEAGVSAVGEAETREYDPDGAGFHDILWAGLFAGGFGAGMSWWWDGINHPDGLIRAFRPLRRLVDGVAFDRQGFERVVIDDGELRTMALVGHDVVLAWVKDRTAQWYRPGEVPRVLAGSTVSLPVGAGRWQARWIDPYGGADGVAEVVEGAVGGGLTLPIPAFSRDTALRLERVAED
jgi:hypothetical protein